MSEPSALSLMLSGLFLCGIGQLIRIIRNRKPTTDEKLEFYRQETLAATKVRAAKAGAA